MLRKRGRRTLSLMLILAMIFSLQVMPVHADAVQTLSLKVADKGGAVQTVKTLTYDQSKNVFMDGAEDSGLVKAFSDQPDGCYAYTGINRKPDPRVLAVATKGILVEDLIAYVQNVSGVKNLKGNTEISFLSSSDNREVKHTYDEYWGVQRYYYPEWYNLIRYNLKF